LLLAALVRKDLSLTARAANSSNPRSLLAEGNHAHIAILRAPAEETRHNEEQKFIVDLKQIKKWKI